MSKLLEQRASSLSPPIQMCDALSRNVPKELETILANCLSHAIMYMLKHWEPLTLFLRVPGAPLDNNLWEQALKRAILHRKNSLFFKAEDGAYIGDLFMSLIHTCMLNRVNPFHYLTTLQRHSSELFKNPKPWLPWNYQQATAASA